MNANDKIVMINTADFWVSRDRRSASTDIDDMNTYDVWEQCPMPIVDDQGVDGNCSYFSANGVRGSYTSAQWLSIAGLALHPGRIVKIELMYRVIVPGGAS